MLPGQLGLLIIGIVSVIALAILGVFSYLAFAKEKRQKEKEARAKRREQWHESMKATADDDLLGSFGETTEEMPEDEAPESAPVAEDEFIEDFDPFALPEEKAAEPVVQEPVFEEPVIERPAPKAPEKPKSTRNDFDFKF